MGTFYLSIHVGSFYPKNTQFFLDKRYTFIIQLNAVIIFFIH